MVIPDKFHCKKLYEWDKLWEKKFSIPEGGLSFDLKIGKQPVCDAGGKFYFVEKKVDRIVFWGEIYWRLPKCCNYSNLISGSQTKCEKTELFIVFATFDRDPEIIM